MSAISQYITQIQNAVYGEQVRSAIVNALQACYSDVENPDLQSAAFLTAINTAYASGILDIVEVTRVNQMTNENIIYRYMGTEAGYTADTLYYYNGSAWVPIGSGVRTVNNTSLMTDTSAIYKYTGTQSGYVTGMLYYHNGTAWVPVFSVDETLSQKGSAPDSKLVGGLFDELFGVATARQFSPNWYDGYVSTNGSISTTTTNGEKYSNLLGVAEGDKVVVTVSDDTDTPATSVAWYNESKVFISRSAGSSNIVAEFTAPTGAKYFRISYRSYSGVTAKTYLYTGAVRAFKALLDLFPTVAYKENPAPYVNQIYGALGIEAPYESETKEVTGFVLQGISGGAYSGTNTLRLSKIKVETINQGDIVTIAPTVSSGVTAMGVQFYKSNNNIAYDGGWIENTRWPITIDTSGSNYASAVGISLTFSGGSGHSNDLSNESVTKVTITKQSRTTSFEILADESMDEVVLSIAHRGFSDVAPENTLPAFKLAKEKGFNYAECDVQFTSDGVPVLLHDETINRTSNGTGNIADLTYAQVSQYDFGAWKGYEGTKIPTFEEFISLCKSIGVHAYIELKSPASFTTERIGGLLATVKKYRMQKKVTWISFNSSWLGIVKTLDPTARLGFIAGGVDSSVITTTASLKTETNEVFLDMNGTLSMSDSFIESAIASDIPIEVWFGTTNKGTILALNRYISGVTNNGLLAGNIIYEDAIS